MQNVVPFSQGVKKKKEIRPTSIIVIGIFLPVELPLLTVFLPVITVSDRDPSGRPLAEFFLGVVNEKGEKNDEVDISGASVFQRVSQLVVLLVDVLGYL